MPYKRTAQKTEKVGDHKAAIQSMGLRYVKKGFTIAEALEIIGQRNWLKQFIK
jgi:hypothetical protein